MAKEKKILIVEDDENISKLVKYNLEKNSFAVFCVASGEEALALIERKSFDLVILDIMLPGIDGLEVCKKIKKNPKYISVPVVMLTAKGEEVDRIVGFELGADDYIVKPFSPRELMLRIKAILKRGATRESADSAEYLEFGKLSVDILRHIVTINKKEVELTPIEFNLLVLFLRRKGRVQSRDVLLSDVWHIDSDITTRTVDTHVKRLRQKLGKTGDYIRTVRGLGYKMIEEE
jgi:two-component system, OmpR family, phosphate regulon response regulator PhoB